MSEESRPGQGAELQPPKKSVALEDSGAHDLAESSDNERDVFSDTEEDQESSITAASSIPRTRVEKIDGTSSHGQIPGTAAYDMRTQDAVPDEVEIIPEGSESRAESRVEQLSSIPTLGSASIPQTVGEKVDPTLPSHGDIPGTAAYKLQKSDAMPDIRIAVNEHSEKPTTAYSGSNVPTTLVTKIDSQPSHGEVEGTDAYEMRKQDAEPDVVEQKADVSGLPTSSLSRSANPNYVKNGSPSAIAADGGFGPMSYNEGEDGVADPGADFGEDFDDFEEGAEGNDFGDFDNGFENLEEKRGTKANQPLDPQYYHNQSISPFPMLDFSKLDSLEAMISAAKPRLDNLFPTTKESYSGPPDPILNKSAVFITDRSLSLWSQLVAPPPLQPPNWVRSRIRRLFLVSLGVPIDLDEILPASKQKKLILPSTHIHNDSRLSQDGLSRGSIAKVKQNGTNASSTSINAPLGPNKSSRKRRGPTPPPELDLGTTRMLCSTTNAALANFTDEELQAHKRRLEEMTAHANEVLDYWLKRKDNAMGDKEAFEGVIENLVKHARKVRK